MKIIMCLCIAPFVSALAYCQMVSGGHLSGVGLLPGNSIQFPQNSTLFEPTRELFPISDPGTQNPNILEYGPDSWGPGEMNLGFTRNLFQDAAAIFKAPLQWERRQWLGAGAVVLSIGLLSSLDQKISEGVQDRRNMDSSRLVEQIGMFGEEYSFAVMAGFYVSGKVFGNEKSGRIARDGLTASILAGGIITPLIKSVTGRSRPNQDRGSNSFEALGGNHSLPSGHTTQAFALASVIAHHYDSRWVKGASYGLASLVGLSRIEKDAHYASDVLAGAAIGYFVGRKVFRLNQGRYNRFALEPVLTPQGMGLSVQFRQGRRK